MAPATPAHCTADTMATLYEETADLMLTTMAGLGLVSSVAYRRYLF
mgnify:CR=1 FL=1